MDEIKQYVENAITDGREVTKHYANIRKEIIWRCDYIFIKENDGWISIIDITDGIYSAVIQAHCHSSKGYETRFGVYRIKRAVNRSGNDFVKYKRMV